jgi:hypothetical protein
MTKKQKSHASRTKEMLLPLPASVVRSISLENHLALATMRSGHGTRVTTVALLRVLYMTFYMVEKHCAEADLMLFLEVEAALDESMRAADAGGGWKIATERLPALEQVLQRSDEVVSGVPKYRYVEAWDRLNRFVGSEQHSPLPGSRMGEVWT